MKRTLPILGVVALTSGLAAGCHDDHGNNSSSTPASSTSYDTLQVLSLARSTSESASPIEVNDNAVKFTDTSDTSVPVSVTNM